MATEYVEVWIYDLSKGSISLRSRDMFTEGIWHTSIVAYGNEYFFGGNSVECCRPGKTIIGQPDSKVMLGTTDTSYETFHEHLNELCHTAYRSSDYDLIRRNCNHFSSEIALYLTGFDIPSYITNRQAGVINSKAEVTIIGNTLASGIKIEGMRVMVRPGMRLEGLLDLAKDWPGVKLVLFGIPDLDNMKIGVVIDKVRAEDQVVLCPFFPPRDGDLAVRKRVYLINIMVRERNVQNGFGSPNLVGHMFYSVAGVLTIKEQYYTTDGFHWTDESNNMAERAIVEWHRIYKVMQEKKEIQAIEALAIEKKEVMEQACLEMRDDAEDRMSRRRNRVERECDAIRDEMEDRCRVLRDECEVDCARLLDTAREMDERKEKREEERARRGRPPYAMRGWGRDGRVGKYSIDRRYERSNNKVTDENKSVRIKDVLDEFAEVEKEVGEGSGSQE